jgi:hypothetical protein
VFGSSDRALTYKKEKRADEGVEKKELSYTIVENAIEYSHYGEQCGGSSKK